MGSYNSYLYSRTSNDTSYCVWSLDYDLYNICMKVSNAASSNYPYLVKGSSSYFVVNSGYTTNKTQFWKETTASTTYYWTDPVVAEHEHEMEYVEAVAPTCGAEGHSAYYRCTVCGKLFSDAAGENEITAEPGRICVSHASCPDQVCVNMGWRSDGGFPIVCLPNKLVIEIESAADENPIDGVVG
jgi:hypothetical protein